MEILKAENLVKYYGKGESLVKAVDHSSFSVASGEFVAIVGTSGSGKSTILNLVGGLDTPDEGRVIIDGQDISKMTQDELTVFRRRKIGFIFQNYNLVSVLNVYKNIVMPVKLDGSQVDKAYISRIMKMLGIENKRKAFPGQLSGGQQQRVAIALTAILITVLCGMGIGAVLATIKEKQMNPGPGCNGAAIMGGVEVYEKVLEQPEVEWADLARLCTEGIPHNKEFAGLTVRLLGVSDSFYGHQYVDLISGEYPKVPEEILLSDTMAEHLGMEMKPGQKMTLNLIVLRDGERVEEPVDGNFVDKKCIRDRI